MTPSFPSANKQSLIEDIKTAVFAEFKSALSELKVEMNSKINTLSSEQKSLKHSISEIENNIKILTAENTKLNSELEELRRQFIAAKEYVEPPNPIKIEESKDTTSKKIVLHGLTENYYETEIELHERVINIFRNIINVNTAGYIEDLTRIGRRNDKRPLVIELLSKRLTRHLLQYKHMFKNTGLAISEYLDEDSLQQRKKMRESMFEARRNGKHAFIRNNKLIINGKEEKHFQEKRVNMKKTDNKQIPTITTKIQQEKSAEKQKSLLSTHTFEAICLSETWIPFLKAEFVKIPNYNFASAFYRKKHIHGGVAILLHDDIKYIERKDILDLSVEFIFECCSIELVQYDIILICIHRLDRNIEVFFKSLGKLLNKIKSKEPKKHIILGGDFNIDYLKPSPHLSKLIDLTMSHNLKQIVHNYTRIDRVLNTSKCIDHIYTNRKPFTAKVEEYGFSDHKGVIYTLNVNTHSTQEKKPRIIYKRLFNDKNVELFKTYLQKTDWNKIIKHGQDINLNYNNFLSEVKNILDKTIPVTRLKVKFKKQKSWLTKGLKTSCYHKRLLLQHLQESKRNPILKNHCKMYSKVLKKSINLSKRYNYICEMKTSTNKTKTMWAIVNKISGKTKPKQQKNMQLKINNNLTTNLPQLIANTFNDYFININSSSLNPVQTEINIEQQLNSIYLKPVDEHEVFKIIKNLKNKNSTGEDEIPPSLLKNCANEFTPPITLLINQSFETGKFPDLLKISIVRPIHKKGDEQLADNYRPIALLPAISKVFEKAMCSRLIGFLEKTNFFDDSQYGFRKKRSTILAVYNYTQQALDCINQKQSVVGILLDLSKAYDKVSYSLLLAKLYRAGIRGKAHEWFQSYLKNRTQYVQIEHYNETTNTIEKIRSTSRELQGSIPQGSVLGCILFLIYINELPKNLNIKCTMFADDISLLFHFNANEKNNCISKINSTLKTVQEWLNNNHLQINSKKTKVIQFHPPQKQPLSLNNIHIDQNQVHEVKTHNLLGIHLDSNLNWKEHVSKTKTKLTRFTYALNTIRNNTNVEAALSAYYAYAESWLRYGIILWGNSTNVHELFVMQKKCIRIIFRVKNRQSCRPYFKNNKILTLHSLFILELATFVRKNINRFTLKSSYITHNLRFKNNLKLPTTTMTLYHKSTYFTGIKIYNKIPETIKSEPKDHIFIQKLKSYLINKCYYSLNDFLNEK
ncbi:reverse transcriptase (RNA-dependent DNA polymerase) domain-containing protein [Phthorimaea operculella]|nr:reverse transcriptase (RNA-dependent DNA polymerase) domain-containing protein [Phthorimaea operculella]